jgi:Putative metal-binding motif
MSSRRRLSRLGRRLLLVGPLAAALLPAGPALAAVGSDDYQAAAPLLFSVPGTVASNLGYGQQVDEPLMCGSVPMTRTAWWRFTGTGQQIALTTLLSSFDTVLAVYDAPALTPISGNQVNCNNDDPAGGGATTSALTFPSIRGKTYLVQVGGRLMLNGRIDVRASSPVRPANDDRISARVLQTGVPATVSNAGASQELGETQTCATANYAATMWFTWSAPAVGDAVFSSSAAFGDTVVTVYRASDGAVVGCNAGSTARVPLRVSPEAYLVQVGTKGSDVNGLGVGPITTRADFTLDPDVDNDGDLASSDCNDTNPSIRHGIVDIPDDGIDQNCDGVDAVNLDRDGDGENRPGDCNDSNPKIHHGATDIPGNKIDEDCAGGPAPFPRLDSTITTSWRFDPFRFTKLRVIRPVAGSRVEIRCDGRGCPFERARVKVKKTRATQSVLGEKLKRARLKRGAVLEVRITKPGFVGFMRRYTVRSGTKDPVRRDFCLPASGGKPQRC